MNTDKDKLTKLNRRWTVMWATGFICLGAAMFLFFSNSENPPATAWFFGLASIVLTSYAWMVIQPKINKLKNNN